MKVNMSTSEAYAMGEALLGDEPVMFEPRRTPKVVPVRVRQKWLLCEASGKRRLTEDAARRHLAAVEVLGRNHSSDHMRALQIKRCYECPDCKDWHLTKTKRHRG